MAGNAQAFALQIDREFAEAEEELEIVVIKTALEALERVMKKTPVDTGRAKGNWFVSVGAASSEVSEATDKSQIGTVGAAYNREKPKIDAYDYTTGWQTIYIQNNLPYIERLENGWSKQNAAGMVAVTLAELEVQFK